MLDADIIHLRRSDGRDWDGILHVNSEDKEKGLLMLYHSMNKQITRTITVPVYYTGLHSRLVLENQQGNQIATVSRDVEIAIEVEIPAKGYSYFILRKRTFKVKYKLT
ncbi:hypothetical protein [Cyclobacterium xiamenense]|uniref:hypothetical protein n=1 Tax=Cyclobacterium xiamenense TaxID=1297121 RepID=UPI0012B6E9CD|nr:hypothetical protein [Cyclobacterium xiamenense]